MSAFDDLWSERCAEVGFVELPTQELRDAAFREFGETPEVRDQKLIELRTKIQELPMAEERLEDLSDSNLVRYLRGKKFDVDKAVKITVERMRFAREHPEWMDNLTAEEFLPCSRMIQVLDFYDDEGRVVVMIRPRMMLDVFTPEYFKANPTKFIRCRCWLLETLSRDPHVQVYGLSMINSFDGLTAWEASVRLRSVFPFNEALGTLKFLTTCNAFRLGGMFLFHEPVYVRWLFGAASLFLSEKIRSRFHICGSDYSKLDDSFAGKRAQLPVSIGGERQMPLVSSEIELDTSIPVKEQVAKLDLLIEAEPFNYILRQYRLHLTHLNLLSSSTSAADVEPTTASSNSAGSASS